MKLIALLLATLLVVARPSLGLLALDLVAGALAWSLDHPAVLAVALAVTLAHLATGGRWLSRIRPTT